jgi:hypothetical protein
MIAEGPGRRIAAWIAGAALALFMSSAATGSCPGDTNGDAVVDINDVLNVLGNWGNGPFEPPGSDANGDGVVDVTDFLDVIGQWGPCPPGPSLDDHGNSGCLPERGSAYEPCPEDDTFAFVVEDDRLHVTHGNATYNCCPEDIAVTLVVGEWLLLLTEEEILETPCDCMCCYEVTSTVGGLAPGAYTVEYRWHDWETGQEQCHVAVVVVEDDSG